MNKQQSKQTFNPLEPYPLEIDTPCYGRRWNPKDPICISCPALNACGTRQMYNTKKAIEQIEGGTPFLSKASRYNFSEKTLVAKLKQCDTKEAALSLISVSTRLTDIDTLEALCKYYLLNYELNLS